ncbi:hypothetical protein LTR91_006219 [Friedmanniomyces endolithicus]|uniref:Metallo-beta-lactamase domain-containing protein n=2 Tax=Friedmanniomyces endolithicus TaxID=329885 RepID=A0AAN6KS63_9PEZI|nr:hypothetical protein LTR91_006219 [Friedmanniomyces endolithicus]KAK1049892.1 hypothetical protein LTS16_003347 [Friedmanniomyces endolithicus]
MSIRYDLTITSAGEGSASESSTEGPKKTGRGGRSLTRSFTRKRSLETQEITGFRNPWPSWHKPTSLEVWQALEWGEDRDPCVALAQSHVTHLQKIGISPSSSSSVSAKVSSESADSFAAQLLRVTKPDFSFDAQDRWAKTTWLGHAGMLVQLPPLNEGGRPVRCLFDPIFSLRCSPTQAAGPIRSYPPPCTVEDLPKIDVVMISHNHYDHLDFDTTMALWKRNTRRLRFVVPLGNRQWFLDSGIDPGRVVELDWWDKVHLTAPGTGELEGEEKGSSLKITCTPSQHGSGRSGTDANASLWSSWYLEHSGARGEPYRVFFAGDSGYQFHASPGWPPAPPMTGRNQVAARSDDDSPQALHPICPIFDEIAKRLGSPHLLMLPIAVGATFDYLRSMAPVPDSMNPIPRHCPGVTAHNHMPPWDAVRVLRAMTRAGGDPGERPVAVAMHWGTFTTDAVEVLKTLGQLEWACEAHNVQFARELGRYGKDSEACFLALNHGESVTT